MKLIEMKNHFYMKGFKPLRITACGGRGCGHLHIIACGGCGNGGRGCGGCGILFASPYMPRIVACGGYGGCGSSLNPGWEEIGGGCGRTYYRYTGCGSPGCGGPLPNSCG